MAAGCAPGPDFEVQASHGVSFALGNGTAQDGVSARDGEAALGLRWPQSGGDDRPRAPYRACELSANLDADRRQTLAIYERFLKSLEIIAATHTGSGAAAVSLRVARSGRTARGQ